MSEQSTIGDLVREGHQLFWVLDFNTQDWLFAHIAVCDRIIVEMEPPRAYLIEEIKACPAIAIIKPKALRH